MIKRNYIYSTITLFTFFTMLFLIGCERDLNVLEPASYPKTPEVFIDGFSAGLNYAAFGGSKVTAFDVDNDVKYSGTASMRIEVPDFEDPYGAYAGGTYFTSTPRDLSGYDALTFWAKASQSATIDLVGIGNDLGLSKYQATISAVKVNTNWKKYYIPIPDPSKLSAERGMFFYSEGPENGNGYTFWIDEVKFEKSGLLAHPKPAILEEQNQNVDAVVGEVLPIGGTFVTFNLPDGTDQRTNAAPAYFNFNSSDEAVATVNENGQILAVGLGTATITAKLDSIDAKGSITVNVGEAPPGPAEPAPTPTVPADKVISLFSNAYTNVPVDAWATYWEFSTAELKDIQIAGNDVKLYTKLNFNGIEFASQTIDASSMTRFHMDIWTPNSTAPPAAFKVLLVDFGANGVFGGGDDKSHELSFTANTNPALATETWVGLDVPLSAFTGLTTKKHLGQLVISGDLSTVYVDNVYFYNDGTVTVTGPTTPAPTPTFPAANVISLFSDAYTNVPVETWSADWDQADVTDVQVAGNNVKKYTNLAFAGIEFKSPTVNASTMTNFRIDIWTPDPTALPAALKIKLVDFGADGVFGGGDDVESELSFTASTTPALATGQWISMDIPLANFTGLTTKGHVSQLIISGDPNTLYVDNVIFYKKGTTVNQPTDPAPTPTVNSANVISVYSDAYTNIAGTDFFPNWGQATVASEITITGNKTLKYSALNYQGIQLGSSQNVSGMANLHIDVWTANSTALNVYLISTGPVETAHAFTVPTSGWLSVDIPLSSFSPVNLNDVIQLKFDGNGDIYIDNIYFFKQSGGGGTEPTVPAPTPTVNSANVTSVYSDAYTNIAGTDFFPNWGQSTVASEITISGNKTLKYSGLNYQGIQLGSSQNVSSLANLHIDVWTANSTALNVYLISTGPVEKAYAFTVPTTGWLSVDIPLSSFAPVNLSDVIQLKFDGDGDVYLDNIYFFKANGGGGGTEPTTAAPTPTYPAADVISLFSNAYTNVTVDTWSADWDQADVSDVKIAGNDTKLYTNLVFAGIEFISKTIDGNSMTNFRMDVWTPDPTASPAIFKIKLVDFGANGIFAGGDDVEHELTFNASTNPALATGSWITFDIPLSNFTGLVTKGHLAQLIFVGDPINKVYVDNILFHK